MPCYGRSRRLVVALSLLHESRTSAYNGKIDAWKSQHTINIQWRKFTHSNRHRLLWLWVDLRFWLVKLFEFPPFVSCRHELQPQVATTRIEVLTLFFFHSDRRRSCIWKLFNIDCLRWWWAREKLLKKKNNFIIKAILWNFSMEYLSSLASWWTFKLLNSFHFPPRSHPTALSCQLCRASVDFPLETFRELMDGEWRKSREKRVYIKYIKYQSENHMKFIIFILQNSFTSLSAAVSIHWPSRLFFLLCWLLFGYLRRQSLTHYHYRRGASIQKKKKKNWSMQLYHDIKILFRYPTTVDLSQAIFWLMLLIQLRFHRYTLSKRAMRNGWKLMSALLYLKRVFKSTIVASMLALW